jgi:hypothetical protein
MITEMNENEFEKIMGASAGSIFNTQVALRNRMLDLAEPIWDSWNIGPLTFMVRVNTKESSAKVNVTVFGYQIGDAELNRENAETTFQIAHVSHIKGKIEISADFASRLLKYDIIVGVIKGLPPKYRYTHYSGILFSW